MRGENNADTAFSSVMAPQAPCLSGLLWAASMSFITGHDGLHQLILSEQATIISLSVCPYLSDCFSVHLSICHVTFLYTCSSHPPPQTVRVLIPVEVPCLPIQTIGHVHRWEDHCYVTFFCVLRWSHVSSSWTITMEYIGQLRKSQHLGLSFHLFCKT